MGIRVDIGKCTGCRRCETACAFFHTGRINNRLARIKALNQYETGIDGAIACVQCEERYCLECPEDALTLGKFGQVIISPTLCTSCGICDKACPIGAIEIFQDIVYVCDLCGGKPKCVEACREGAITFEREEKEHLSLTFFNKKTAKMNPSQKRYFYVQTLGGEIRKEWSKVRA